MKLRAAIFDFDGTLFDSMGIWATLASDYLREKGIAPQPGLDERLKIMSLDQAALLFQRDCGLAMSVGEITDEINRRIERLYLEEVLPKPGAAAFVQGLRQEGVRCCIATATDRCQIEAALVRSGLSPLFDGIVTCAEAGHGKDEPYIYREAMARMRADRGSTAVFEDALHAAGTAKADGFITVGVYDRYEPGQEELRRICDVPG